MIRLASMSDVAGIRALMKSIPGFWNESWRADVLERVLASPGTIALVHDDSEMIDGFACAHDVGFRAYLSEFVVSPTSQGRGAGARLLSELERRLSDRGCSVVIADVWRDAEGFYRSHGWTPPAVVLLRKSLVATAAQPSGAGDPARDLISATRSSLDASWAAEWGHSAESRSAMQGAKYVLLGIDLLSDYFRQHAGLAGQRSQLVASVNRLAAAFRQACHLGSPGVRSRLE